MSKHPTLNSLKEKIKELEKENTNLRQERAAYRELGVEIFKVVAGGDKNSTMNSMWLRNKLAAIYSNFGMPFMQWKKEE